MMARAERHESGRTARKDDVIQIRAMAGTKALLNRAAAMRGQKLSEFMLESARREAENPLLNHRRFCRDVVAHEAFVALLDAPPAPSSKLVDLMARKPAWDH